MPSKTASELVTRWQIPVALVRGAILYSANGDWYHAPKHFPAALLDRHGYVVFESEAEFRACPLVKVGRKGDVGIPKGIRAIYGYVRMMDGAAVPEPAEAHQS